VSRKVLCQRQDKEKVLNDKAEINNNFQNVSLVIL
jgi:hypothetical protein